MKTSLNIAARSAQMIRAAVKDLRHSVYDAPPPRERRDNALDSLSEIANQLDQYSPAFEPASETNV